MAGAWFAPTPSGARAMAGTDRMRGTPASSNPTPAPGSPGYGY
ncbi:hypothetical protein ABZW30_26930 [Kitasatospora sp. NPDC004669]